MQVRDGRRGGEVKARLMTGGGEIVQEEVGS